MGGEGLGAGDVGPCSDYARGLTDAAEAETAEAFEEQITALAAAGVDLLFLETFADLRELQLAARIARASGLPVHASFTVNEQGETAVGSSALTMLTALETDPNVDTVGLNCAIGPAGLFDIVEKLLPHAAKPLLVKPNAGFPRQVGGRMLYMTSPEYFTEYAKRFVQLGVRGFGGCCGTTPQHIAHAAKAIRNLSGVKRHAVVRALSDRERQEIQATPMAEKSRFAAKLARGERVTSVEIMPPKSPELDGLFAKVRACHFAGVDAINIPDGPRASARVSPMVTALLIRQVVGIEPIPHYYCRDRNLLGMQSDILGAGAEYAITQPVFDAASLLRFLERIESLPDRIPVIAGIWPLASFNNAEFMRNEVPGVVIPDPVMAALAACQTRDEARAVGIAQARAMMAQIASRVAGFQVSAPLGNVQTALQVLDG